MKRRNTRWPAHVVAAARAEQERLAALEEPHEPGCPHARASQRSEVCRHDVFVCLICDPCTCEGDWPPRPQARERAHGPRLTKLEARYRAWLELEQAVGRLARFQFHPWRIVLHHGTPDHPRGMTYQPDTLELWVSPPWTPASMVQPPRLEVVEVKPTKSDGSVFWAGDSRTKVLAAAELWRGWPWSLVLVTPDGSGWRRTCL